jgi:hypothetical protein
MKKTTTDPTEHSPDTRTAALPVEPQLEPGRKTKQLRLQLRESAALWASVSATLVSTLRAFDAMERSLTDAETAALVAGERASQQIRAVATQMADVEQIFLRTALYYVLLAPTKNIKKAKKRGDNVRARQMTRELTGKVRRLLTLHRIVHTESSVATLVASALTEVKTGDSVASAVAQAAGELAPRTLHEVGSTAKSRWGRGKRVVYEQRARAKASGYRVGEVLPQMPFPRVSVQEVMGFFITGLEDQFFGDERALDFLAVMRAAAEYSPTSAAPPPAPPPQDGKEGV